MRTLTSWGTRPSSVSLVRSLGTLATFGKQIITKSLFMRLEFRTRESNQRILDFDKFNSFKQSNRIQMSSLLPGWWVSHLSCILCFYYRHANIFNEVIILLALESLCGSTCWHIFSLNQFWFTCKVYISNHTPTFLEGKSWWEWGNGVRALS